MPSQLPLSLALFAALLLPSCVQWNIGAAIRDAADVRVGVDVAHPVDGKRYVVRRKGKWPNECYVYAPEVRYHQSTPMVELDDAPGEPPHARPAVRLRPTGRVLLVRIAYEAKRLRGLEHKMLPNPCLRPVFKEEVAALPPGARARPMQPFVLRQFRPHRAQRVTKDPAKPADEMDLPAWVQENQGAPPCLPLKEGPTVATLGTLSLRRSSVAAALAAPFDYVVDPVLSGLSTALFWTGGVVVGVGSVGVLATAEQVQQAQPRPAPAGPVQGELSPAVPGSSACHSLSERPKP